MGGTTLLSGDTGYLDLCHPTGSDFVMHPVVGSFRKHTQKKHPQHEAPNVGPPGHAARCRISGCQGAGPLQELHHEPEAQNDECRDFDDLKKENNGHESQDTGPRIEQQVCAEDSGDRPAGSYAGDLDIIVEGGMDDSRTQSCKKVKESESSMAETILHIVAKNPEVPHVPDQVKESAVQKHRCKEWQCDPHQRLS